MAHIPVLLKEAVDGLSLHEGMIVLDATLGGGGHSKKICEIIGSKGTLIATDEDNAAINRTRELFKDKCNFQLFVANFKDLGDILDNANIPAIDAVIFDLGLSSFQLEDSGRGFSFQKNEPLLMTFSENPSSEKLTAGEIVNNWEENNLADIIFGYGGERYARRIARVIVETRETKPIKTTYDLVEAIEKAVPAPYKRKRIHFATKTFQALRITVNDEIGSLKKALNESWKKLKIGGMISVISFHEIEDRVVKNFLRDKKNNKEAEILTKKPMVPTEEEMLENPRSRSAKLRIGKKINAFV